MTTHSFHGQASDGEQDIIRCVLMRGGTSKALYFLDHHLPPPGPARDRLLQRLMGSPDVMQIDGLGGSHPVTSKVAIISRSQRHDADVDYTFAQVDIGSDQVVYTANCGNISSGVGPFAVDEGLVTVQEGNTRVRIYNTNTDRILVADVPVRDGRAKVEGTFRVPGVPGSGAEIVMNWAGTVGAKTGKLLPTGKVVDDIGLEDGTTIQASLVDAGNPCVWVTAEAMGIDGSELGDVIDHDEALLAQAREVRGKAAVLFGLCEDWRQVDQQAPAVPILGMVAEPASYRAMNGEEADAADMDLRLRLLFMNELHQSVAGTASVCIGAASRIEGTIVAQVRRERPGVLMIGHPSGITPVKVQERRTHGVPGVTFEMLGFSRTARRLMDSNAYYPRSTLETVDPRTGIDRAGHSPHVVHEK